MTGVQTCALPICFAVIGATIADNFGVAMPEGTIGTSILKQLE